MLTRVAIGLSFRAAATLAGCTHRSIAKAVRAGRIPLLPDGTVAIDSLEIWQANRRAPRGGLTLSQAARACPDTTTARLVSGTEVSTTADAALPPEAPFLAT